MEVTFDECVAGLAQALGMNAAPDSSRGRVSFEIEGAGTLVVEEVGDRVLFALAKPRLFQGHPSGEDLLRAAHFSRSGHLALQPFESPDGAACGFAYALSKSNFSAQTAGEVLDALVAAVTHLFAK